MITETLPSPAPVAETALTADDARAAVARGTAAGAELVEQLIRGAAEPEGLFETVQHRCTTPAGVAEAAALLNVVASVVRVFQPTMQAYAQQAAAKAVETTTPAVATAVYNAVHAQQAEYLEGIDKALRDIHAAYVHDSEHAAAPFFVPPLPEKAKQIIFVYGDNGEITGATLRS